MSSVIRGRQIDTSVDDPTFLFWGPFRNGERALDWTIQALGFPLNGIVDISVAMFTHITRVRTDAFFQVGRQLVVDDQSGSIPHIQMTFGTSILEFNMAVETTFDQYYRYLGIRLAMQSGDLRGGVWLRTTGKPATAMPGNSMDFDFRRLRRRSRRTATQVS